MTGSELGYAALVRSWPVLSRGISWLDARVPDVGVWRNRFEDLVFTQFWNRWYKLAYIPEKRDLFFAYILTYFYRYPIKEGDVIVQVGASYGEETRRFARAVGRRGRVIAVEPEAGNLGRIRTSVPEAEFPQVTIVPKGAWKEPGELSFFVGGEREHRIVDLGSKDITYDWWGVSDHLHDHRYRGKTTIQVDTLDNIIAAAGVERVDFILVETNGAELECIEGLDKALPRVRRIGARGHVRRDGVPIHFAIRKYLDDKGLLMSLTSEEMVLARQPGLRP
jgi:FkbM family methyltransferase